MLPVFACACIVMVFCLGYYFGRTSTRPHATDRYDAADWWKRGEPPPY